MDMWSVGERGHLSKRPNERTLQPVEVFFLGALKIDCAGKLEAFCWPRTAAVNRNIHKRDYFATRFREHSAVVLVASVGA
jgi:hypothetical protein